MIPWQEIILILALVGSALMAGLFFIFSNTVMTALSKMPDAEGIRAMQQINRVILNPLFLVFFTGTAILSIGITILGLIGWGLFASTWFLSAACLNFFGTFFYTIARNVPLNEKLEKIVPEEASAFWQVYLKDWTRYNHHRAIASVLAVALYGVGLIKL